MKNTKKVKLITHLGISGDLDLNIPNRTTFKLQPYRLSSGVIVGEFDATPEQVAEIQKSKHWAMTYIQFRDDHEGEAQKNQSNHVSVGGSGTVVNPLGFSPNQTQIIENALLVKPALRGILADNVLDACKKVIDAENLPPKVDPPAVAPTNEEILAMDKKALQKSIKAYGGKYDAKADITANQNILMDLVANATA